MGGITGQALIINLWLNCLYHGRTVYPAFRLSLALHKVRKARRQASVAPRLVFGRVRSCLRHCVPPGSRRAVVYLGKNAAAKCVMPFAWAKALPNLTTVLQVKPSCSKTLLAFLSELATFLLGLYFSFGNKFHRRYSVFFRAKVTPQTKLFVSHFFHILSSILLMFS